MPPFNPSALLRRLVESGLLEAAQVDAVAPLLPDFANERELCRSLADRGWLTSFQADTLPDRGVDALVWGNYLLEAPLGRTGGQGTVYRARHRIDRTRRAVKLIHSTEHEPRLEREAEALRRLDHPNIVRLVELVPVRGHLLLVMDYIEGEDLKRRSERGHRFSTSEVCELGRQVANGLDAIHRARVFHRDIKPDNLILNPNGQVCIVDLGLALLDDLGATRLTDTDVGMGTVGFVAPEQARSAHDVDHRADIYGLGATLYYLLTGRHPFGGRTRLEKLAALLDERTLPLRVEDLRPDVPLRLARFLHGMIEKDRDRRRPKSAAEVGRFLAGLAGPVATPEPVIDTPTPPAPVVDSEGVTTVLDGPEITNCLGMTFRYIPAGTFLMGSPEDEVGRDAAEAPRHPVRISRPFYVGVHLVTWPQYLELMPPIPDHPSLGPEYPVQHVKYEQAVEFCERLTRRDDRKPRGWRYRLLTEAEWEYVARAGTETPFHFGPELSSFQANCDGESPYGEAPTGPNLGRPTPVNAYPPNAWGVHDVHGNLREWCQDFYDARYYAASPAVDPTGPAEGRDRVARGGSYHNSATDCRSAKRWSAPPHRGYHTVGIRVALVPPE